MVGNARRAGWLMNYISPRAKLLYHTDRLAELRATGHTAAPVNVEIDLTNRCSHGCEWCHFAHTHTRGPLANKTPKPPGMLDCGDQMDYALIDRLLCELMGADVRSITWTGGGEPTLHPQFNKIVSMANLAGIDQGLYTNGGHIDSERAQLLKTHMTFVYVSLDECSKDAFAQSKGVDRFDQVCMGIGRLVVAPGPATIGVGFLLHPGNVDDIDRMVALGRKLGVDYVQFRPIVNYAQDAPNQLVEDTTWINHAINRLRAHAGDPFVQADTGRFELYRDWNGHGYPLCHWSALQTVITPNGRLWRCVNKRGHQGALLGDLTKEAFATIWARSGAACAVDSGCRVMCRGAIANLTLNELMTEPKHPNFI